MTNPTTTSVSHLVELDSDDTSVERWAVRVPNFVKGEFEHVFDLLVIGDPEMFLGQMGRRLVVVPKGGEVDLSKAIPTHGFAWLTADGKARPGSMASFFTGLRVQRFLSQLAMAEKDASEDIDGIEF